MARKTIETVLIITLFSVLFVLYTWPFLIQLDSSLHSGDPYLTAWILSYCSAALFENPTQLFDAPAFHPHATTLAYSENLLGMQPFYLPALLFTGDRVAAYNLLVFIAYILAGTSMYLFCRFGLGWKILPAGLAGLIFTYTPYRLDHIYHIHVIWTFWMPLAAWLLIRTLKEKKWRYAIGLSATFLMQATASLYVMTYIGVLLVVLFLFLLPHTRRRFAVFLKLGVAAAVSIILLIPLLLPYMSLRSRLGFERTQDQITGGGAFIEHLLAPSYFSAGLHQSLFASLSHPEKNLFIGFACLALFTLGMVMLLRKNRLVAGRNFLRILKWFAIGGGGWLAIAASVSYFFPASIPAIRTLHTYTMFTIVYPLVLLLLLWLKARSAPFQQAVQLSFVATALVGVCFALGPQIMVHAQSIGPGPFSLLMNIPLIGAFRATARWFNLALVGISITAAAGMQLLLKRFEKQRLTQIIVASAVLIFVIYEHIPGRSLAAPPLALPAPEYTEWLKKQPDDFAIIELPIRRSTPAGETVYLVRQRDHGKKIVNGYSGFESITYQHLANVETQINDATNLYRLRSVSARYCIVHFDLLNSEQQNAWREVAAQGRPGISFIQHAGSSLIFEITAGANGKYGLFYTPPEITQTDFKLRGRNPRPERFYFVEMFADDVSVKTVNLSEKREAHRISLPKNDHGGARKIEFFSSYLLAQGSDDSGMGLPFLLHLETGGNDPNHCVAGINGRYWPREKGINVYRLDRDGKVLEYRTFNTSWYHDESDRMADYLTSLSGKKGYLLVISRHLAARRLTEAGRAALGRLGLNNFKAIKDAEFAIGIVDQRTRLVVLDRVEAGKITYKDASFESDAIFELTGFNTR